MYYPLTLSRTCIAASVWTRAGTADPIWTGERRIPEVLGSHTKQLLFIIRDLDPEIGDAPTRSVLL